MLAARLAKLAMVASLAAFAFLVTFDNITDYATNFAFVQHVLSMDTTFPDNALLYRAITQPWAWHAAYSLIIVAEGLTCACFVAGSIALLRHLRADAAAFERAKRFAVIGATLAFLVWFTGFMVVGGEWFAMWQSKVWNGQQSAFRFYLTALAVLLFVTQPDRDLAR
jgi:predicted small integral membrane protein